MISQVLGFNYKDVLKCGNLNVEELFILKWFMEFYPISEKKTINGIKYGWVRYSYFLDVFKGLGFKNKRTLSVRFNDLVKKGFLLHEVVREGGTYSYFSPTALLTKMWEKNSDNKQRTDEKTKVSMWLKSLSL